MIQTAHCQDHREVQRKALYDNYLTIKPDILEENPKNKNRERAKRPIFRRLNEFRPVILKLFILIMLIYLVSGGCTAYKPLYKRSYVPREAPDSPVDFTFFLIGDTGDIPMDETLPSLDGLKELIAEYGEKSAVVFLGDNIYPVGMPEKGDLTYDRAYHRLSMQLEALKDYKGHAYFIAGNHDWYEYEELGIRRQERIVDSTLRTYSLANNNFFRPDSACADPQIIELTSTTNLLLMDSQWLLAESRDSTYRYCEVHNTDQFFEKIEELLAKYKDEIVLVSLHHPIYTYGHHGGKNSLVNSLFPLTWRYKYAFLPMPILGNVFNLLKSYISPQDFRNKYYKDYRIRMLSALVKNGKHIVAAGHEHNLQYIEYHDQVFVVSGAGSKKNGAALGRGSKFCVGNHGFVQVDIHRNGEAYFHYYVTEKGEPVTKVFETGFVLKN